MEYYDVIASLMLVSAGCALGSSGIESEDRKSMNPIPMNETVFLGLQFRQMSPLSSLLLLRLLDVVVVILLHQKRPWIDKP